MSLPPQTGRNKIRPNCIASARTWPVRARRLLRNRPRISVIHVTVQLPPKAILSGKHRLRRCKIGQCHILERDRVSLIECDEQVGAGLFGRSEQMRPMGEDSFVDLQQIM